MLYPGHVAESIIQDDIKSHHSGVIQQGVEMAQLILMETSVGRLQKEKSWDQMTVFF